MFEEDLFGARRSDVPGDLVKWAALEDRVRLLLAEEFTGGIFQRPRILERQTVKLSDETVAAPDFVVDDDGCRLCVAEAKCRKRITRGDAVAVARYADIVGFDGVPRLYVPATCHVERGALAIEVERKIAIHRVAAEGAIDGTGR